VCKLCNSVSKELERVNSDLNCVLIYYILIICLNTAIKPIKEEEE
jgi:hypothetical protein